MNHNLYFSMREAQLKREAEQHAADQWRLANPGYRRRRWQLPQFGHLFDRARGWARTWLSRPVKPQEQCC